MAHAELAQSAVPPRPGRSPRARRARSTERATIESEVRSALLSTAACVAILFGVWELVCLAGPLPSLVLPAPLDVLSATRDEIGNGYLLSNTWVTLREAIGGFVLATLVAAVAGYIIAHVRALELLVAPFVAAGQGVPTVALAPIIILLLGTGLWPKVVICAAVVLFPLLVTTVTGIRRVDRDLVDVARVFGASRRQMIINVELPQAAPVLLSGVKLGLTLSVTGAVVAEFVASDAGLGFMVNSAINSFEVTTRYVALLALAVLSGGLYGFVTLLERIIQRWLED